MGRHLRTHPKIRETGLGSGKGYRAVIDCRSRGIADSGFRVPHWHENASLDRPVVANPSRQATRFYLPAMKKGGDLNL
eukprot:scaffold1402_cov254-Pinguiococcus_pyrenoidosus.AAC.29